MQAGRKPGKVYSVVLSTHPAIASVVTHDRRPFLDAELKERRGLSALPRGCLMCFWELQKKKFVA